MGKLFIGYFLNDCEGMNAHLIPQEELAEWLSDGSLDVGDEIYEVKLKYKVIKECKLVLGGKIMCDGDPMVFRGDYKCSLCDKFPAARIDEWGEVEYYCRPCAIEMFGCDLVAGMEGAEE